MKYLKTFESDESDKYSIVPKEVQDQIKDILLDLEDKGYTMKYDYDMTKGEGLFCICIKKYDFGRFGEKEIMPVINRLGDYLNFIGYDAKDLNIENMKYRSTSLYINFYNTRKIKVEKNFYA